MKKSLFSSIIKSAGDECYSIRPYSMGEVPLASISHNRRERFTYSVTPASSNSSESLDRLLKEIEEREKYIKQITDKTHSVEKDAYEKGFAQGEKAGRELGEKRFEAVVKSLVETLEGVRELREKLYQESEHEMLELVLAIARRVIQREVGTDRTIMLNVIRTTLKYAADRENIKVRLNPSDLEFVSEHREESIEKMGGVTFEGDERVLRGNAVVETVSAIIECGIEHHLQKIEESLRAQLGEYPHAERGTLENSGEDGAGETGVE